MMSSQEQLDHLKIDLETLIVATHNFDNNFCIGRGGFGRVYKGELHWMGHTTTVAIRRFDIRFGQEEYSEFWKTEIMMLSLYKHENIIPLLGFCDEIDEKILVYKYASNKSLDSHLDSNELTWVRRLTICIGAARGLEYLHDPAGTQQRLLHRDIKSSNIMLDENWNSMITGLDLSKIVPANQENDGLIDIQVAGTVGYCDPVYIESGILTKESDVYSFGVVLFEVLCGMLCIDYNHSRPPLTTLVRKFYKENKLDQIIFHNIKDEINPSSLTAFVTIAYQCLSIDREDRPSMQDVVRNLENARKYQIFTEGYKISLSDIHKATENFAVEIGRGGFGTVYKGELVLSEGTTTSTTIAAKRLKAKDERTNSGFENERKLSQYRNDNIVNLLGYCDDGDEKILIYEYAHNESLDHYLHTNDLRWVRRLEICIGAARGLRYLHNPDGNQESVWHLDIKSGNILLDKDWNAKVTDFGLSKFGVANRGYTTRTSRAVGTPGYCDPIYRETGLPAKESDIYSFGVMLFEVLCGRLNGPDNRYEHQSLAELTRTCYEKNDLSGIIFGNIKDEINPCSLGAFATIAYRCLQRDREERPSMDEIVIALETALKSQVSPVHLSPPPTPSSKSSNEYRSLKPLHWETSRATVGSLWDVSRKHGGLSRAPEIDISELESLFCKRKHRTQPSSENPEPKQLRLVHPDRANSCEIMLQDINLPLKDIIGAILALDSSAVSVDQVYDLNEFCPTNEEMEVLKGYTRIKDMLGKCEKFFLECARIPRIDSKLQVFAFKITFSCRVNNFRDTLNIIKDATKEIMKSTKLAKIMQIILMLGNKLNAGTNQGSAGAFKLDSLERLGYTWATDEKITLLHFLCKVVAKQTPELLDFYKDLTHLKDAYWIQNKNLYKEKSAIIKGLEMVQQEFNASANDGLVSAQFRKGLVEFFKTDDAKLPPLISLFDEVDQYADSLVIYFGEDPNRCSWKQVITSMVSFVEMFKKAHTQNKLLEVDARRKKLEILGKKE